MKKNKFVLAIVLSFIIVLGLSITPNKETSFLNFFNGSYIYLLLLIVIIPFINNIETKDKRIKIASLILAIIIALIDVIGRSLNIYEDLSLLYSSVGLIIANLIRFMGIFTLVFNVLKYILDKLINNKYIAKIKFKLNKKTFFLIWLVIFLLWIPYLLMTYPGILSIDSIKQIEQAIGATSWTNHHPVFHTLIISVFVNLGKSISSLSLGVLFYSIFQMIAMSGIFAYTIYYLLKKNTNKYLIILISIFFALFPVNGLYSVTMWKDIMFGGVVLLLTITISKLLDNPEDFFIKKRNYIYLVILTLLTYLLRNNGFYVLIITLIVFIIVMRNYRRYFIVLLMFIFAFNLFYKGPVFEYFNIKEGSVREMLSIPSQQLARVEKKHHNEMSKDEIEAIEKFFINKNMLIGEYYNPRESDDVKRRINEEYFAENKKEFIKLWFSNLRKYPLDYVESFLMNNYGY